MPLEALDAYQQALKEYPDNIVILNNLGNTLNQLNRYEEAKHFLRRALELDPNTISARTNLAHSLSQLRELDEAEQQARHAITLGTQFPQSYKTLGAILLLRGKHQEAEAVYRQAIALWPQEGTLYGALSEMSRNVGDLNAAEVYARQAVALSPELFDMHGQLGLILHELTRWAEAEVCFRQSLALAPHSIQSHCNICVVLALQGKWEEAETHYQRTQELKLTEDDQVALTTGLNWAYLNLRFGRFTEGWKHHEVRLGLEKFKIKPQPHLPQWYGAPVPKEDGLVVYFEQGLGDAIQFSRFFPTLQEKFSKVRFVAPPHLQRLMQGNFPGLDIITQNVSDIETGYQWQIPILSLGLALGIEEHTIPNPIFYLKALPEWTAYWGTVWPQLQAPGIHGKRPKIGFVWAGNPEYSMQYHRSCPLEALTTLFAQQKYQWISLQMPPRDELSAYKNRFNIEDASPFIRDLADTAGLMASLDLVISVDTSVAHLAAALGKPVWLLNRFDTCWRWMEKRTDTPWYPTMRIFRQPNVGDWAGAINAMAQALENYFENSL